MRHWLMLSGAATLAACGGSTAPQSVGSSAPPSGGSTAPTPTPSTGHSFVSPTEVAVYDGLGAVSHYEYKTDSRIYDPDTGVRVQSQADLVDPTKSPVFAGQYGQLYAGNANTARNPGVSVTYNPRDAIFELTIQQPLAQVGVSAFRFQDPAHRTDFGGARQPQAGVPNIELVGPGRQIQYLETGSSSGTLVGPGSTYWNGARAPISGNAEQDRNRLFAGNGEYSSTLRTFFYQKPGTTTKYVTYAGYVSNTINAIEVEAELGNPAYVVQNYSLDRGAFVFGERTGNSAVPRSGSATFSGEMLATMAFNPQLDSDSRFPTFYQWIVGNQTSQINFADLSVKTDFAGTVTQPMLEAYNNWASVMPAGSRFFASATSLIDLVSKGGFAGQFTSARFTRPGMNDFTIVIAGSSIDGAFFGPGAEEIGGGFRIVGGTPDERIDILGAFTGKK